MNDMCKHVSFVFNIQDFCYIFRRIACTFFVCTQKSTKVSNTRTITYNRKNEVCRDKHKKKINPKKQNELRGLVLRFQRKIRALFSNNF